jgi:hypothetical protein
MPTSASANLITALKNSLADANAGWVVRSVTEVRLVSNVADGNASLAVEQIIDLEAVALGLRLGFVSVAVGGVFREAFIRAGGGEWRTTDAALNTTVTGLASTFLTAKDTVLKDILNAGPNERAASTDLIDALTASIEDESHGWTVRSRIENSSPHGTQIAVSLGTLLVKTIPAVGVLPIPTQFAYLADVDQAGALISARLLFSGAEWRARDAGLHTAIMALADAYLETQNAALVASLEAGPA